MLLVRTLCYDKVYDLLLFRTLYVMTKLMICYWSEHCMLRPSLGFVTGQNAVCYDQVYDLLLVKTLYAMTKFKICYWSKCSMLRPSLWFATARSRRFRILARKIEFGVFGLFRMRKKIFSWKNRGFWWISILFPHIILKSVRNCPNTPNELGKKFEIVRILRIDLGKKIRNCPNTPNDLGKKFGIIRIDLGKKFGIPN